MWRINKTRLAIFTGAGTLLLIPSIAFAATQVQTTICEPLDETTITAPATTSETTDSSVQVIGRSTPGKIVTVYRNGLGSGATTTTSGGTYALSTPLDTGTNNIVAVTVNECSTTKQSLAISVIRTAIPTPVSQLPPPAEEEPVIPAPKPVITSLAPVTSTGIATEASTQPLTQEQLDADTDNAVTEIQKDVITKPRADEVIKNDHMWVKGKTQPNSVVAVYINKEIAAQVLSDSTGLYGVLVNLMPGTNTVHVKATAQDGTVTTRVINVKLVSSTSPTQKTQQQTTVGDDTVATVITLCIGVGGLITAVLILAHIPHIRAKVGKK